MITRRIIVALVACAAAPALAGDGGGPGSRPINVDYIPFTVASRGEPLTTVVFDVLSVEAVRDGGWFGVDLNNDEEIACIDSYIHVFSADVRGGLGDWMGENDDNPNPDGAGYGDGSLHAYDSYLELALTPGNYIVAISGYSFSEGEARAGVNDTAFGIYTVDMPNADDWTRNDHGDYRIVAYDNAARGSLFFDVEGTIREVPAPAAALTIGLAGLFASRRRR